MERILTVSQSVRDSFSEMICSPSRIFPIFADLSSHRVSDRGRKNGGGRG